MRSRTVCSETSSQIARSSACPQPRQNRHQAFRLWQRSWKTVENESVAAMQTQPVFNQFNDNFVGNEAAVLDDFGGF